MTLCSSTTSSLKDPLACLLSDTQSAEGHLGHVKDPEDTIFQTVPRLLNHRIPQIVGDGANADGELGGVTLLLQVPHQARERERRTVDPNNRE